MDKLSFKIDTAQRRLYKDRRSLLVSGSDWDKSLSSNIWIDPVTKTVSLLPLPFSENWKTQSTGDYYRLHKSDYAIPNAAKWVEGDKKGDGHSNYLWSQGTDESVITTATYAKNVGFYVSYFVTGTGNEKRLAFECGWNNSKTHTSGTAIRVHTDGYVEVWRNGKHVGQGNVSGSSETTTQLKTVDLIVVPHRQRELLVVSNQGGGFVWAFDDISEDESGPTITPTSKFWWHYHGDATVEAAPLRFLGSGYAVSRVVAFTEAPLNGATPTYRIFSGETTTASLVDPDNINVAFAADGTKQSCRFKVNLSTSNTLGSPLLQGVEAVYDRTTAMTDGSHPYPLINNMTNATLDVSDDPSGVQWTATIKNPIALKDSPTGVNLFKWTNRAFEIKAGSQLLCNGRTNAPEMEYSTQDVLHKLTLTIRDPWKAFETYLFSDPVPLDGENIVDAFKMLIQTAGFESTDIDIAPIDFFIPSVSVQSQEWNVLIEVGDSIAEWLKRLRDTYLATYIMGWFPMADGTFKFRLFEPDPGAGSTKTLYCTRAEAKAAYIADGMNATEAEKESVRGVYRAFKFGMLDPEGNIIYVTGYDPRTEAPLRVAMFQQDAADPTIPLANRPDNWYGEPLKYGWVDSSITTEAAAEYACRTLFNRLTPMREIAEWEADFMYNDDGKVMWRGDVVTIKDQGRYRIISFSGEFDLEPIDTDSNYWRPFRYVGEYIGEE